MKFNDIFKNVYVVSRHESKNRHELFTKNMEHTHINFNWHFHGTNPCYKWLNNILKEYMLNDPKIYLDYIYKETNQGIIPSYVEYLQRLQCNKDNQEWKLTNEYSFNKHMIDTWTKPGYLGTTFAHVELIQRAKNEGWDNIVIFEDDSIALRNFEQVIGPYLENLPEDWDFLSFGSVVNGWFNNKIGKLVDIKKSTECGNILWITLPTSTCLPCYAIKNTMYDIIIDFYSENYDVIDNLYKNILTSPSCYGIKNINGYITFNNIFIPNPYSKTSSDNYIFTEKITHDQFIEYLGLNQISQYCEYVNYERK